MASTNRAALIAKVVKVAKKHFKPVTLPKDRPLLENLVFACCAENSPFDVAEKVFQALSTDYFDWNEVRVSTLLELSEKMKLLNDPDESATRLKRVLNSVFETHYSFDLEIMKKQNIGQSVKTMGKYNGSTPFIVSFVVQQALAGHSIPINEGLLESMRVVGVISDAEAKKHSVPGLERAVPKNKGVEVGTMLHQLGVELSRSPYGSAIRKILLEIDADCKDRLPKRAPKKPVPEPPKEQPKAAVAAKADPKKSSSAKSNAKKAEPAPAKATPAKAKAKVTAKKTSAKATTSKATAKKKIKKVKKKVAKKKVAQKPAKKAATKKPSKKKKVAKKKVVKKKVVKKVKKKKPTTKKKAKRKPR